MQALAEPIAAKEEIEADEAASDIRKRSSDIGPVKRSAGIAHQSVTAVIGQNPVRVSFRWRGRPALGLQHSRAHGKIVDVALAAGEQLQVQGGDLVRWKLVFR